MKDIHQHGQKNLKLKDWAMVAEALGKEDLP